MINVQMLINDALRAKQKAREESDYEQTSWYISGFGNSMVARYMARLGIEPDEAIDDRLLRVFDLGNKIEDWVVDLIKENDTYEVDTQKTVRDDKLDISGRLDILLTDKETKEQFVMELKSKNSRAFWYMDKKGEGAQRHHMLQLWGYLYLLDIPKGHIVYISKDDESILEYPVFLEDESLRKQFLGECAILNYCWENKIPPPADEPDSWQIKYNNYKKQIPAYLTENPPISKEKVEELLKDVK